MAKMSQEPMLQMVNYIPTQWSFAKSIETENKYLFRKMTRDVLKSFDK